MTIVQSNGTPIKGGKRRFNVNQTESTEPKDHGMSPEKLRLDGGTQSRVTIDQALVEEYAEAMKRGINFPPVVAFAEKPDADYFDDENPCWLADGFHRTLAEIMADLQRTIHVKVHKGGRREAVLYSVGANANHGLRRSNEDKRRAVMTLLNDEEWSKWSDVRIADQCGVSDRTVAKYRAETRVESFDPGEPEKRLGSDGKEYTVKRKDGTVAGVAEAPELDSEPLAIVREEPAETKVEPKSERPDFEGETQAPPARVSDAEWLESLPCRSKLSDRCRAIFDADALAYREIVESDQFAAIKRLIGSVARKTKDATTRGAFTYRIGGLIEPTHPRSWLACGLCDGTGHGGCDDSKDGCRRRGYVLFSQ